MEFKPTRLPEVILIEPKVFGDARGYFMETWQQRRFGEAGIHADFVQDNQSRSDKGILRGLHYQIKQPQGKLVRVLQGEVFDVAVDLRRSSPTLGEWVAQRLSSENKNMLWVPPGFAHGFYVLSDFAEFFYKCTDFWAPEHERCILWNDPDLNIDWPLEGELPILSDKDATGSLFKNAEIYA